LWQAVFDADADARQTRDDLLDSSVIGERKHYGSCKQARKHLGFPFLHIYFCSPKTAPTLCSAVGGDEEI
jgi:hypothetical protein